MHISPIRSAYTQMDYYAEQQLNAQIQSDQANEEKNNQEIQQLLGIDPAS